jgi:hypothetical protein
MRKQLISVLLALAATGGLAACTPDTGTGQPSATPGTTTGSPEASSPGTVNRDSGHRNPRYRHSRHPGGRDYTARRRNDSPAPAPPAASPLPSGPSAGDAELSVTVKASKDGKAVNYTLVCKGGAPMAESQHPNAAAACTALKNNAAIVNAAAPPKGISCTQQYGGPEVATVTGEVNGTPVETSFALRDGCQIGAWNAAKDILGAAGGAL